MCSLLRPCAVSSATTSAFGFAQHQRFRLRQHVGDQLFVMRRHVLMRIGGDQEIGGDHRRALVDQLVEGVLAVGARLAPDHRAVS